MKPLQWYPPTELPDQDFNYPIEDVDVSVRVVVEWNWDNPINREYPGELRFARYWWPNKGRKGYWMIDGISGNTLVKRWIYIE
jgi:hypothetical protein